MSYFFLDSSALVKRYLSESGSNRVTALVAPPAGNTVVVAEIARVEVAAALAARHRAPGGITLEERDEAVDLLLQHFETGYQITPLGQPVIGRAVSLTQDHRLRGYDAVQLASALAANDSLVGAGLAGLTFVAADEDLVSAAQAEGLTADNPNRHQ